MKFKTFSALIPALVVVALGCQNTTPVAHLKPKTTAPAPLAKVEYGEVTLGSNVNMAIVLKLADLKPKDYKLSLVPPSFVPESPSPSPDLTQLQSVQITLTGPNGDLPTQTVNRADFINGTATFEYSNLPPGHYSYVVTGYTQPDAQGDAVSTSPGTVELGAGQQVTIPVLCQPSGGQLTFVFSCPQLCQPSPMPSGTPTPATTPTPVPTPIYGDCASTVPTRAIPTLTQKTLSNVTMNPTIGIPLQKIGVCAFDSHGTIYLSNSRDNGSGEVVRRATTDTSCAQIPGWPGGANQRPDSVVVDANDNVYADDYDSGTIYRYVPGSAGFTQFVTGLNTPRAMALGPDGNMYVAELGAARITKFSLTPNAVGQSSSVSVFAQDSTKMHNPYGLAFDASGTLYVSDCLAPDFVHVMQADAYSHILRVSPAGAVSYFAGSCYGYVDGSIQESLFSAVYELGFDADGNLIVPDYGNAALRHITPSGSVETVKVAGVTGRNFQPYYANKGPDGKLYATTRSVGPQTGGELGIKLLQ